MRWWCKVRRSGRRTKTVCRNIPHSIWRNTSWKSAIESSHPYNLGGVGVTGNLAANTIAKEADLVIGIGTRFTDFTTASKQLFQNEEVEFLNINISEFHANKLDALKVIADAKEALLALIDELQAIDYRSSYTAEIADAKEDWETELIRLHNIRFTDQDFKPEVEGHFDESINEYVGALGTQLTQTAVIGQINTLLDEDAIIVGYRKSSG